MKNGRLNGVDVCLWFWPLGAHCVTVTEDEASGITEKKEFGKGENPPLNIIYMCCLLIDHNVMANKLHMRNNNYWK